MRRDWDRVDLLAVGWLCLVWLTVLVPGVRALRAVVVLPAVLLLPGYALVGALVPPAGRMTAVERAAFSVVASVATDILLGIGLLVSVGLTTTTALLGVSVVVVGGTVLARHRRPETGGSPRDGRLYASLRGAISDLPRTDGFGAAVAGVVVLAALAGGGGTAFLTAVHDQPGYTELAVLPPENGSIAAEDYRQAVADDRPLEVRVTNQRQHPARYAVVVVAERIAPTGQVGETRRLDRVTVAVPAGETVTVRNRPTPPWSNHTRRLVYRLYRVDGGERHVADTQVWLNATGEGPAATGSPPEEVA